MNQYRQNGSIVAYILIIALTSMVILLGLLQQVSTDYIDTKDRYYNKLAEAAAEAGTSYALACIEQNNRTVSWGAAILMPNSNCNGTINGSLSQYVYNDTTLQTTFTVDPAQQNITPTNGTITATGTTSLLRSGTVIRTYTVVQKRSLRWDTDNLAQATSSGTNRTCGILSASAWCWGQNNHGQLGDSTFDNSTLPVRVIRDPAGIGTNRVRQIVSGNFSNCILLANNQVWCWGFGNVGQMGNGTFTTDNPAPIKVNLPSTFQPYQLAAGFNTFCALGNNGANLGQVWCWGADNTGQVGNGQGSPNPNVNTPVQIAGPGPATAYPAGNAIGTTSVTALSYGGAFSQNMCAIASNFAYCWGANDSGQIGNNSRVDQYVPVAVARQTGKLAGKIVVKIAIDGHSVINAPSQPDLETHTCALAYPSAGTINDAAVYCWGSNADEALGNVAAGVDSLVPVLAGQDTGSALKTTPVMRITDLAVSGSGACVLAYRSDRAVSTTRPYCWGHVFTRGEGASPVNKDPLANIATDGVSGPFDNNQTMALTGGAYRMCAIADYRIYCWGVNTIGQIGNGTQGAPVYNPTEATFLRSPPLRTLY